MKSLAVVLAYLGLATAMACGSDPVDVGDDDGDDDGPSTAQDAGKTPRRDSGTKDSGATDASTPRKDANSPGDDASVTSDAGDDDAGPSDGGASDGGGPSDDGGADAAPPASSTVWLNEILSDPPGQDSNNEFVELGCKPGESLASYWFVIVEGDYSDGAPTTRGKISFAKQLSAITCGAGGLVVLQRGSVYEGVAGTVYMNGFFEGTASGVIEGGSQTYWLTSASVGAVATDVDANDDGVVDDAAVLAKVVDSVGISDGTAQDLLYSPAALSGGDDTGALSRFAGSTATAAASWYFGDVTGPSPWSYTAPLSANFPPGGTLSPGGQNTAKP